MSTVRRAPRHEDASADRAELDAGARSHFEDPAYYTKTYAAHIEDVAYYARLGRRADHVLEYGIGNGRVAIPLVRFGGRVTGIDHSEPMLADLRRRLAEEPSELRARVRAFRGDMRTKRLKDRFDLVIAPFNVALHLYTRADVEAFFARVREHLAPGGAFVCDLSVPSMRDLARDPDKRLGGPRFRHPSAGVVKYEERFRYDALSQVLHVAMTFTPVRALREPFTTPLTHRQFFPQEWEALLHYNGFDVTGVHGDFDGGPLTGESDVMIWHARARKGHAP